MQARNLARRMLEQARRIDLLDAERGKYFRIVARVVADGKDVGHTLIARGLAVGYDGGKKTMNWCGHTPPEPQRPEMPPTPSSPPLPSSPPAPSLPPAPSSPPAPPSPSEFSCSPRKTCGEMISCDEAYFHLNRCKVMRLDHDQDGVPCESVCQ